MQEKAWTKTALMMEDARAIRNASPGTLVQITMQQTNDREYRYEERHGHYLLKCWHNGVETSWRGEVSERPEWLERILAAATVGGHLKRVTQPPPNAIVWFTTDLDNNLLTFLELT
jgi:hypothetical protein